MASFMKSQDGVRVFCVWSEGNPEVSLTQLETHIKHGLVNPDDFDRAVLCYEGLTVHKNAEDPAGYPLKFKPTNESKYAFEVWISGVSTGYDGSGPRCAVKALKRMGFEVSEKDIFELPAGDEKWFYK